MYLFSDENLDAPDPAEMQALAQAMHPGSNVTIPSTIRDKSQVWASTFFPSRDLTNHAW